MIELHDYYKCNVCDNTWYGKEKCIVCGSTDVEVRKEDDWLSEEEK